MAASPDCGAVGGNAPVNALVDLSTGKIQEFNGYNDGFYYAGSVNGLAVDPNTGIAATTAELNSQVELRSEQEDRDYIRAATVQNRNRSIEQRHHDRQRSGEQAVSCPQSRLLRRQPGGGALVIYDEKAIWSKPTPGSRSPGNVVIDPPPRINPGKRMGWLFGGPEAA